jgi:hypothetical protein
VEAEFIQRLTRAYETGDQHEGVPNDAVCQRMTNSTKSKLILTPSTASEPGVN